MSASAPLRSSFIALREAATIKGPDEGLITRKRSVEITDGLLDLVELEIGKGAVRERVQKQERVLTDA